MLKGYAKPIVFSVLIGMLMLTGVYSYAIQQTGVVPISTVLAAYTNEFYMVVIEAQLPNLQIVNYTLLPENTTAYIPAGSTLIRIIPYMNATYPYIVVNPGPFPITIDYYMSYSINGVDTGNFTIAHPFVVEVGVYYNTAVLAANFWLYKTLSYDQVWAIKIWAVSYLA